MSKITLVSVDPNVSSGYVPVATGTGDYSWGPQSGGGGGGSAPTVLAPGNSGSAQSIDFASTAKEIWLAAVQNSNLVVTLSNRVAGSQATLMLVHDNTANVYTLGVSDGSTTVGVSIVNTANAYTEVQIKCPSATVLDVASSASGGGGSGITSGDVSVVGGVSTVNTVLGGSIPVTPAYASQGSGGYLAAPPALHFDPANPAWEPAKVYARGDVVVDPYGTLRYCGVAHTSPSTFSAGTEFSTNSPWWGILTTNGTFRGIYQASQGTYITQYAIGDLVLDPGTGLLQRALYEDAAQTSYNSARYDGFGIDAPVMHIDPGVVMPPSGMPGVHAAVHALGFWPKTTRLQYPRVKPLLRVNVSTDFTSVSGGAVTADPDPIDPNGCPQIAFSGGSGTIATVSHTSPSWNAGATVDISNAIVRFPIKVTSYASATNVGSVGAPGLSTGAPITSIPLDATGIVTGVYGLVYPLSPGMQLVVGTDVFTVAEYVSASAGRSVTQIPVNSQTPGANHAAGVPITTLGRGGIASGVFQVSSDNFSTHVSQIPVCGTVGSLSATNLLPEDAWGWAGSGPGNWLIGTGFANVADLTAINAVRWKMTGAGANVYFSVSRVDIIPNNGQTGSKGDGRAKCVLWGDNHYIEHWTYLLGTSAEYGFPICCASSGAIDNQPATKITYQQLQHMTVFHQCQNGSHYYFANDGGDNQSKSGPAKDAYINRARHSIKGAGLWGHEDHAWHDDDHMAGFSLPIMRKYFRSVRGYRGQDSTVCSLPPVEPMFITSYGVATGDTTGGVVAVTASTLTSGTPITSIPITTGAGAGLSQDLAIGEQVNLGGQAFTVSAYTSAGTGVSSIPVLSQAPTSTITSPANVTDPGSAMKSLVDATIAAKGLCQFSWENIPTLTGHQEVINICAYLDAKRASIDVVTISEALDPWVMAGY